MVIPAAYQSTQALEAALGDPFDARAQVSFGQVLDDDESSRPPGSAFAALDAWRFPARLVPRRDGGELACFEELLSLLRALARRDPVLAVGYGSTLLASIPVWAWGGAAQRGETAAHVLAGRFGACAVSEEAAGSDLAAIATRAERTAAGFRLDGAKWMIGNATRARFVTVLARSGPTPALFLLDKKSLVPGEFRHLPKVPTLGLRGHDLSGIAFHGCGLPGTAALGPQGRGLEMLMATLRFTRTLAAGVALGAADSALRIALARAGERRLYGRPILSLAPVQGLLTGAYLDILISECVTISTARELSLDEGRGSLRSAITKYLVPLLCERAIRDSGQVLAARSYLRDGPPTGMLQKLSRDAAVIGVFEGTAQVQLAQLASWLRTPSDRPDPSSLFRLARSAAPWRPERTGLGPGRPGPADPLGTWEDADLPAGATARAARLRAERDAVTRELRHCRWTGRPPPGAFALAHRYCVLYAAGACHRMWLANQDLLSPEFKEGQWLAMCWDRLLALTDLRPPEGSDACGTDELLQTMLRTAGSGRLLSIVELRHGR
ncbi:acyl-CoA dehydrogenase [Actinomadura rubrisoli]|uniref:Acyl-CoA dehydrogenase n=1 Tax=Actinomadura rubrisoli TaxID=2530368 RepID=A0A4R5BPI3_9ACTN|nr:acyl-CoA dehydrogenase [Actinomadura rubrisoli]TDD87829.1 acyl-CoA dehydrogenase [Actinomadura rubrisoli]